MNKLILSISIAAILSGCNSTNNQTNKMEEKKSDTIKTVAIDDTTPKVIGIGGIFFFTDNPKGTKEWYNKNLGLKTDDYGSMFESRDINKPEQIDKLQWSPFKKGSDYFAPSKKEFMINYRVQNIERLVEKLKKNGVTVVDSIVAYGDYGKFVHIMDPEGNKIELWEPNYSHSTKK